MAAILQTDADDFCGAWCSFCDTPDAFSLTFNNLYACSCLVTPCKHTLAFERNGSVKNSPLNTPGDNGNGPECSGSSGSAKSGGDANVSSADSGGCANYSYDGRWHSESAESDLLGQFEQLGIYDFQNGNPFQKPVFRAPKEKPKKAEDDDTDESDSDSSDMSSSDSSSSSSSSSLSSSDSSDSESDSDSDSDSDADRKKKKPRREK